MTYFAVNKNGKEVCSNLKPHRDRCEGYWVFNEPSWNYYDDCEGTIQVDCIVLPKGSIEKITGKKLTWEDEPIRCLLNNRLK